jgi:HAD superfamily hydrolase (TIGR01509 family)
MDAPRPELVIFDCDGVLVDSEGPVNEVLAASLSRYGLPMSPHDCESLFVAGTMFGVFDEARRRGAALPDAWVEEIYADMFVRLAEGVALIDGVMGVIDALEAAAVPMWVASNGPMQKMKLTLGPHGLWDRFEGRILSREQFKPKPAPDMVHFALGQTGARATAAVLIDDTVNGCNGGINAGVRCLGYAERGQGDALFAAGAEVATTMKEVRNALQV